MWISIAIECTGRFGRALEYAVCLAAPANAHGTDGADGADGVINLSHPDHPGSGASLTSKGQLDAQGPEEGLGAPQAPGERAGIFGPPGEVYRILLAATEADPQQVGGAARPGT